MHLSRLAEELVLWTSAEYGFAQLDDSAATGSSIMPQKKNPDPAELARGKAGTAVGRLAGLLATLKGLPLAYNRDLQEDKRASFDQVDDLLGALRALTVCIAGLAFDPERMAAAAGDGTTVATDLAERLVREGMPFPSRPRRAVAGRVAAGERFDSPGAGEAAAARQPLEALHDQLARARSAVSGWLTGARACAGSSSSRSGRARSSTTTAGARARLRAHGRRVRGASDRGTPVVVVSSGAVALGIGELGRPSRRRAWATCRRPPRSDRRCSSCTGGPGSPRTACEPARCS